MPLDVLYLDNHLLVVNKPPGLLVQGDRTGDTTLLDLGKTYLKERYGKPGNVFLALVHRLDRPASGVMVLARTSKAADRLTGQFRERLPDKRYLVLVEGRPEGEGTCVDYLVKEDEHVRVVPESHPGAKRAVLRWEVAAVQGGRSLLDVRLETGRPHQIRVQLAHRGWPVVGDRRYGARSAPGSSLALHCYRLTAEHPTRQVSLTWTAPLPPGWPGPFREAADRLIRAASGEGEKG